MAVLLFVKSQGGSYSTPLRAVLLFFQKAIYTKDCKATISRQLWEFISFPLRHLSSTFLRIKRSNIFYLYSWLKRCCTDQTACDSNFLSSELMSQTLKSSCRWRQKEENRRICDPRTALCREPFNLLYVQIFILCLVEPEDLMTFSSSRKPENQLDNFIYLNFSMSQRASDSKFTISFLSTYWVNVKITVS